MKHQYSLRLGSIALGCALIFVNGCSFWGKKPSKDGTPKDINVTHIPNAKPRVEAYSKGGNPKSYEVFGKRYYTLPSHIGYEEVGTASWYGTKFHGRTTSNGERYDVYGMTAAHKSLPIPTFAEVTNLDNGKKVIVRVNDRGPFVDNRLIDMSYAAAKKLDFHHKGTARVKVKAIDARKGYRSKSEVINLTSNSNAPKYIQLGAFSMPENAKVLAQKTEQALKPKNVPIKIVAQNNQSNWLYKVVVGPITDSRLADSIKSEIHALKLATATIINEL